MATSVPRTGRAAVLFDFSKDVQVIDDHPVKQPSDLAPGECLVKVDYSGVCHSDLHIRHGEWARKAPLPLVGGHEGIGHVVAIGEHTTYSPIKVGDRVGLKWIAKACLRCEMCRKGAESSCPDSFVYTHGYSIAGTFQSYAVAFVDYVTPIPEGMDSAEAAPILCGGVTVYKALKQTNTIVGNWVAISGAGGGLGHLAVQYAVAMGLRVIAIDTGAEKKDLALKLGAEKWIDFKESTNIIQEIQSAADGVGPHAAVIAAGDGAPFNQAIMYLRPTGTLVAVGMPGNAALNVPIPLLIGKSLTIRGTAVGNRQDSVEALALAASGKIKCHYQLKELGDLNGIYQDMANGKITGRIVLKL
ncbi:hypothetical protein HGRIS_013873 [Hohenbuehelia grisea]|uniref:alcohol dehydrogenase n=1 Tax=Hohenbuehelia grisea TaxID=104357 RepID=A0ABR3IWX1_9AGAR